MLEDMPAVTHSRSALPRTMFICSRVAPRDLALTASTDDRARRYLGALLNVCPARWCTKKKLTTTIAVLRAALRRSGALALASPATLELTL